MAKLSPDAHDLLIAVPFLLLVGTVGVALRVISNIVRSKAFVIHDYLIFLSWTCLLALTIDQIIGTTVGGYGFHLMELIVTPVRYAHTMKAFWASQLFWATGTAAFRLAILLLYVDLFPSKKFVWTSRFIGGIVVAYWVSCILTTFLLCRPLAFNWNPFIVGAQCGNLRAIEYASGGINLAIDLVVVFLPLPVVLRLQMSSQNKAHVILSFLLGLITAGVNIGRIVHTHTCDAADVTYCVLTASIFVTAEVASGLLVACAPTFGPVFLKGRRKRPSARHYIKPSGTNTIGGGGNSNKRSKPSELSFDKTMDESSVGHEHEIELTSAVPGAQHAP